MSSDRNLNEATPVSSAARQSSMAIKLAQAAALAAVLVPLGTVAVETESMTCGFYGASTGACGSGGTGGATQTFDFGQGYKYTLTFLDGSAPFFVTINNVALSQEGFDSRESLPGSYDCVPLVNPGTTSSPCVDFNITDSSGGTAWDGYVFSIAWLYDSGPTFPNGNDPPGPTPGQVRVLQNPGSVTGDAFLIDMCLAFPTPGCQYTPGAIDPEISSGDTDFSSMTVAWTAVPEPASIILVGAGLGGLLYRRRRRRGDSDPPSTA